MSGVPTQPNLPTGVASFNDQLAAFQHGSCWLGDGGFGSKADITAEDMATQAAYRTFLEGAFSEISDLGENPGKESSTVVKLKTSNYVVEGKRTNTIELTLIGLNQERTDWLESELNKEIRTIILLSADEASSLVFSGMRWTYERESELNGLYTATISTEYSGPTKKRYFIIKDIPVTAT
jgi:hypothetical protein